MAAVSNVGTSEFGIRSSAFKVGIGNYLPEVLKHKLCSLNDTVHLH